MSILSVDRLLEKIKQLEDDLVFARSEVGQQCARANKAEDQLAALRDTACPNVVKDAEGSSYCALAEKATKAITATEHPLEKMAKGADDEIRRLRQHHLRDEAMIVLRTEELRAVTAERDAARAEVERLKALAETRFHETIAAAQEGLRECVRAEKAEAELTKERARLDWLSDPAKVYYYEIQTQPHGNRRIVGCGPTLRSDIDAAMKEPAP